MASSREFSRKRQAADQTNTPVEEMQSHPHIPQPELPPKAYTYGEGWCFGSRSESLLRESRTAQSIDTCNLSIDTLGSYERLSTNIPASPDGPLRCQERRYREKVAKLVEENDRLRMENAELKANIKKESEEHTMTLGYWVKAEKELADLLRVCQKLKRHEEQTWGHADYYEEDNDVGAGDIEFEEPEESERESAEEGDIDTKA